ncbi:hypothetical protein CDD82_2847 [Ophiocordyceps australis]|uniref:Uncharacterized protein n=1 Tax=Ophiocordyceps australis TaxID=1399860 RepID=A0A2C5ZTA8_9HYPO|nr:hypothetical protein CDD82_2847 [Ophiocordyceps australis]
MISSRGAAFSLSLALCLILCPSSHATPTSLDKRGWPFGESAQAPGTSNPGIVSRIRNHFGASANSVAPSMPRFSRSSSNSATAGPDWTTPGRGKISFGYREHNGQLWSATRGRLPTSSSEVDTSNPMAKWYTKDREGNWRVHRVENGEESKMKLFKSETQDWNRPRVALGPNWKARDSINVYQNGFREHNGELWSSTQGRLPTSRYQIDVRNPHARWYEKDEDGSWRKVKIVQGNELVKTVFEPTHTSVHPLREDFNQIGDSDSNLRLSRTEQATRYHHTGSRRISRDQQLPPMRQQNYYSFDPTSQEARSDSVSDFHSSSSLGSSSSGMRDGSEPSWRPRPIAPPEPRRSRPSITLPVDIPGPSSVK